MAEIDDMADGDDVFSMEDLEKDLKKGRGGRRWLWCLIGLAAGVGGTVAAPRLLAPYLPDSLMGSREILSGPVLAEERTGDRLLLTIATEPGALIASFTRQVDEIALLVDPGDIVTIAVPDYEPFVENPDFKGVRKQSDTEADADVDQPPTDSAGADSGDAESAGQDGAQGSDSPDDTSGGTGGETAAAAETAAGVTPDTTAGGAGQRLS